MSHPSLITQNPRRWTVTGAGGFIGSHLADALLRSGQHVVGLDDFSTGSRTRTDVLAAISHVAGGSFTLIEGSIEDREACTAACDGAEIVLHQAALVSIPRSIQNPRRTHEVNVTGTLNMLTAARDAGVLRFVYASSSSVYGDDPGLPKQESRVGLPLAPYASSKLAGEYYARNFTDHYKLETVGLRYFNVFGPGQDADGAYAAVIPRWIEALSCGRRATIYGDGETSRDFCYVANVIQANLRAATYEGYDPALSTFNIANGDRTTLNDLHRFIVDLLEEQGARGLEPPVHAPERKADVRHSQADISRARSILGYAPTHDVISGLRETVAWYCANGSS